MNHLNEATNENAVAMSLGAALNEIDTIGNTPVAVLPPGFKRESMEQYLPAPTRSRGHMNMRDMASFVSIVKQESKGEQTRIYGCYEPASFTAVFNDNFMESPGWRDHTATFSCPQSVEWKTWAAKNKVKMAQVDFAQFIEDNLPDIVTPAAADMLEISRTLEAKKSVNFASAIRLSNGQNEFTYEEQVSGTANKGKLQIPEIFTIGIPVLEGGEKYGVECRLRYRIDGGKMLMWFDMLRPHKVVEDAIKQVWLSIEEGTGLPILNGN